MRDDLGKRISGRRWIAWKLVRLAHRIHDADYRQVVRLPGTERHLMIEGSEYGHGVTSSRGFEWHESPPDEVTRPVVVDFDDFDEALDWAFDGKGEPT